MPSPDYVDVQTAAERLRPFVRRTPVFTCSTLDTLAGRKLHFKCELFQKTGSFKYRGATNALRKLSDAEVANGVVTQSSGNHGQAVARAARERGVRATVVMPRTAAAIKKAAVIGYGAEVVESGPSLPEREAVVNEVLARTGGALIPPFDHPDVIAGQGTAALELLEDVPELDALLVPVGGGGLISGFCLAANGTVRVFGAEPEGASAAAQSKAADERVKLERTQSIADGLLANYLGTLTWPIVREKVEAVFTVSEAEIVAAMRLVWERMKLVIEPSAAVGLAAALGEPFRSLPGLANVGLILCGGNVNLDRLPW